MSVLTFLKKKHCTRCPIQCNKTRIKGKQIEKEEVHLSLVVDDIIGLVESPKKYTKQLLELINIFSEDFNLLNSIVLNIKNLEKEHS